ncbi:sulfatase-like hydrolase/transferase [Ochrovirga pacifica]|uniref:sulfatase-like hydrolase/transferase n=1 Tax=Ochrovirga pacifica TaxID=1042376 RepID=UPI000255A2CB|nr:sulfatase-like hydrolase/transferase [Ochrovirga pacifica]
MRQTIFFLLTIVGLIFPVNSKAQQKKNLLFIIVDQQRSDALSFAGNKVLKTPNLDRLAKEGAYFRNAYTPMAVCGPARSSILTGMTVENTGVNTNDKTYFYDKEPVMTSLTFDEILAKNGYHSEYYGKWHSMTNHTKVYKNPKKVASNGKSMFEHGGQSHMYADYLNKNYPKRKLKKGEHLDKFTNRAYIPNQMDINYNLEYQHSDNKQSQPNYHGKSLIPKEHTLTAYQAKQTINAIERLKDKPFNITVSFHFPHAPMIVSEPYYSKYPAKDMEPPVSINDSMKNNPYSNANGRKQLTSFADKEKIKHMISEYYGLISELDDWLGKIFKKLDEEGVAENTLIIYTSDHGEMLGAHGMREKNVFYEESSHIPLIIKDPQSIKPKTRVDGYVSTIDLFSTILDYLKIEGTYPSDGKSLRGLIEGTDRKHGKYVVTEWDYRGDVSPNYMIVKDGWKMYIPKTSTSNVIDVLYNLKEDPYEMNNLLGNNPDRFKYQEKVEELRSDLLEWLKKNKSKNYQGVKDRIIVKS